jgi:hypothetical protein
MKPCQIRVITACTSATHGSGEAWRLLAYRTAEFHEMRPTSLIVEVRYDEQGEYEWFVTLWKATKDEAKVYEQNI